MPGMQSHLGRHKPGSCELTITTTTDRPLLLKVWSMDRQQPGSLFVKNAESQALLNQNPHLTRFPSDFIQV